MTQTLGTDDNNDMFLGLDGNVTMWTGEQAVLGGCATAAKAQLGEMIYASTSGMPNFEVVWVGVPNAAIFETYLRSTLSGSAGVTEVKSIAITIANNELSYAAVIVDDDGNEVTING